MVSGKKAAGKKGGATSGVRRKPAAKPKPVSAEEKTGADGLTTKQRLFVEYYLSNGFNATEAARAAGYKGNENTLSSVGYENLRKPEIAAVVSERVNEAAMGANEVLARLSAIARGSVTDVLDEDGRFDIHLARRAKKDGLLKKLKRKTTKKQVDARTEGKDEEAETIETSIIYEEVEFEMYSAHEALRDLGTYHKLFVNRQEVTGKDGTPLIPDLHTALEKAYGDRKG
jgi:phage terminase small subunit